MPHLCQWVEQTENKETLTFNDMLDQIDLTYSNILSTTEYTFFFFFFLIYFWLCWAFISVWGLSPVAASGGHSSSRCAGLSLSRPLPLQSTGSRHAGSVVVAHGLAAPRHVRSSWTRAQTRVPCIGRRILNHCATREAPEYTFLKGTWNILQDR